MRLATSGLSVLAFLSLGAGCSIEGSMELAAAEPIVDGRLARDYPEAVLVDSDRGYCSGAVIGPRVVLTAGHCVKNASRWTVTAPFARAQVATSTRSWTKYTAHGGLVNPRSIDVALLVLDSPIELETYPAVASEAVRASTKAINVGRVRDGVSSRTALFFGPEVPLGRGQVDGYPYSYVSPEVVESGDSGGPAYVRTSGGRLIVAVSSGGAGGRQVLARVDLVRADIDRILADNP
jgi:hypothetical protein